MICYGRGFDFKLAPGIGLGFAQAIGCQPQGMLAVDNNRYDLKASRRAGTGVLVGVLTGTNARKHLSDLADHVFDYIAELEDLV